MVIDTIDLGILARNSEYLTVPTKKYNQAEKTIGVRGSSSTRKGYFTCGL